MKGKEISRYGKRELDTEEALFDSKAQKDFIKMRSAICQVLESLNGDSV